MSGAIGKKWETAKDVVGDPTAPMRSTNGGYWQQFHDGVITYKGGVGSGAYALSGASYTKWKSQSDTIKWTWLGFPNADSGDDASFEHGVIIRNKDAGAEYMIGGANYRTWVGAGKTPVLGYPTSDEVAGRGGGIKRMNWFQQGAITWDQTGSRAIVGPIYNAWKQAGSELSSYGAPRSNQVRNGGATDQKFANRNYVLTYVNGRIITESGGIGGEYIRRGMSKSDLGYPLAAMTRNSSGWQQNFYNGNIKWTGSASIIVNPRISSHTTTAAETRYTYRSGCPVAPSQLTTTQLNYYNFNGRIARGVIITRAGDITTKVQGAFTQAGQSAFSIRQILNPDYYKGDDPTQMSYDNTSAFNCRKVTGNPYSTSPHSYGVAVDINTFENPYQDSNGKWWPTKDGAAYWRTHRSGKGVLTGSDPMTRAFVSRGAFWGARWSNPDYQHFEWD